MKRAILNVAVGGRYPEGQQRLVESLEDFAEKADLLMWQTWLDTPHSVAPYRFKPEGFLDARNNGYEQVIWIDASCWLVKPLDQAWAQIERDGYLLGQEGWSLGQWCNDRVLDEANLTREQANDITLMEGKLIGLDLTSEKGNAFLDAWDRAARRGWFNGDWSDHRHDISAGAIIAHRMELTLTPNLIQFANDPNDHPAVYVKASGL